MSSCTCLTILSFAYTQLVYIAHHTGKSRTANRGNSLVIFPFHIFINNDLLQEIKGWQFEGRMVIHHPFKGLGHCRKLQVIKHLDNIIVAVTHLSISCFLMRSESGQEVLPFMGAYQFAFRWSTCLMLIDECTIFHENNKEVLLIMRP